MKKIIVKENKVSEVKPVENISKNWQIFLEISPCSRGSLPSHKLQEHAYEFNRILSD